MTDVIMRFWLKRREKLIHDYSLVGYLLSPNSAIMAHSIEHKSIAHDQAAERLITKLILNPSLVGNERSIERAKLIDTFMESMVILPTSVDCLLVIIFGLWPTI